MSREIKIGNTTLAVKDYYCCAEDGLKEYIPRDDSKLWLYINITDICNGACRFCINPGRKTDLDHMIKSPIDLERLREVLLKIKEHVYGVSITGGEPMLDMELLDKVLDVVVEVFGVPAQEETGQRETAWETPAQEELAQETPAQEELAQETIGLREAAREEPAQEEFGQRDSGRSSLPLGIEIDTVTNGVNFEKITELRHLRDLDSIHLSRHCIEDEDNNRMFGFKTVSRNGIKATMEKLKAMSDPGKIVFNCAMQKSPDMSGGDVICWESCVDSDGEAGRKLSCVDSDGEAGRKLSCVDSDGEAGRKLSCVDSAEKMGEYLEMAAELGVTNTSFIGLSRCNEYCRVNYVDPGRVYLNKRFRVWNAHRDHEFCRCVNGDYVAAAGPVRFYVRCVGTTGAAPYARQLEGTAGAALNARQSEETGEAAPYVRQPEGTAGAAPYARQLVYTADNRLLAGFGGEEIEV